MSRRVVVSGVGFVHPCGVGCSSSELDQAAVGEPEVLSLGGGRKLYRYSPPELSGHPFYPDRKMLRSMRADAVMAYLAAIIALEDARAGDLDQRDTSLHMGVGQSYADMWPFLRQGLEASMVEGRFEMSAFARRGQRKIYPFFSIRALPALPLALISERFQLRGESSVQSSLGAETAVAFQHACDDIRSGRTNLSLVGGADSPLSPHTIESLYFNDFYRGDFHASASASFVVLEEREHNLRRRGRCYSEIVDVRQHHSPPEAGARAAFHDVPYSGLELGVDDESIGGVVVNASGTLDNHELELPAARQRFVNAGCESWFESCGGLLAAAEPFGTILLSLQMAAGDLGVSLSRSVFGAEAALIVSKVERDAP